MANYAKCSQHFECNKFIANDKHFYLNQRKAELWSKQVSVAKWSQSHVKRSTCSVYLNWCPLFSMRWFLFCSSLISALRSTVQLDCKLRVFSLSPPSNANFSSRLRYGWKLINRLMFFEMKNTWNVEHAPLCIDSHFVIKSSTRKNCWCKMFALLQIQSPRKMRKTITQNHRTHFIFIGLVEICYLISCISAAHLRKQRTRWFRC